MGEGGGEEEVGRRRRARSWSAKTEQAQRKRDPALGSAISSRGSPVIFAESFFRSLQLLTVDSRSLATPPLSARALAVITSVSLAVTNGRRRRLEAGQRFSLSPTTE